MNTTSTLINTNIQSEILQQLLENQKRFAKGGLYPKTFDRIEEEMKVGDLVKFKRCAKGTALVARIETFHADCKPVTQVYLVGYPGWFRLFQLEVINENR